VELQLSCLFAAVNLDELLPVDICDRPMVRNVPAGTDGAIIAGGARSVQATRHDLRFVHFFPESLSLGLQLTPLPLIPQLFRSDVLTVRNRWRWLHA
jgi:hypothetical protein